MKKEITRDEMEKMATPKQINAALNLTMRAGLRGDSYKYHTDGKNIMVEESRATWTVDRKGKVTWDDSPNPALETLTGFGRLLEAAHQNRIADGTDTLTGDQAMLDEAEAALYL